MSNEPGLGGDLSAAGSQRAVFLSYASEDASAALRLCTALRDAGIEVWFDRSELRGGDAWDNAIRRQIKSCALFVPIISANTHARIEGYFRLEWKLAVDRSHLIAPDQPFLLPVVIDGTPQDDERIPDRFRELQWTRLPEGASSEAFVARVARLLGRDGRAAASRSALAGGAAGSAAAEPTRAPPARSVTAPRLLLVAVAGLAAGVWALDHFVWSRRAATVAPGPAVAATPATAAASSKSIAVLPFVDMSEKHDQEYFSDGLAEELLDLLAKVPDLQVIARTSSFSFKGKSEDVPTIARKLNVGNVLEGSVRKSGRRVRITTQLIRADTGVHLWSETYDRDLEDVFKVQDEIARAVVEQLKVTLLTAVPITVARTASPEAYNLFLQGRYFVALETDVGTAKGIEYLKRAIAVDPAYAPAWSALSFAYFRQLANGYVDVQRGIDESQAAAQKAIELDPASAEGYAMLGSLLMTRQHDWAGARMQFEQALRLEPGNSNALFSMAHLTRTVGSTEDAVRQYRRVLERDPLNLLRRRYFARVLFYAGQLDEAEATIRAVLEASPSFPAAHYELGRILLARGQAAAAAVEFDSERSGWRAFGLPLGYHAAGRAADEKAAMAALLAASAGSEFQVAEAYATLGNPDQAFAWLDQAVVRRDPGIQWLRGDPQLKSLTHDARYAALLERLKLPP